MFKGILIDQSVDDPHEILALCTIDGDFDASLEGEANRGRMQFIKVIVEDHKLDKVLELSAARMKSPGWYFHLVDGETLYVAYPGKIMSAKRDNDEELQQIVDYGLSIGIHADQLNLKKLYDDPYA